MFHKHDKWNSVDREKGVGSYVQMGATSQFMGDLVDNGKDLDQTVLMVVESHWEIYGMEEIWFNLF